MPDDATRDIHAALARADAAYPGIAPFGTWTPEIDLSGWDQAAADLAAARSAAEPADVDAALHEHLRAAAVDTGAIEGLYSTDRGFTLSVAKQQISLDQAEVEKGPEFRRNYEAQLAGFEMVLDVATAQRPMSESLIRQVHEMTCQGQSTCRVLTPVGVQERPLVLGAYKTDPNHVQLADGSFHAYAPVGEVAEEVRRLVVELQGEAFAAAHPVLQAAYAHHAFTSIHPFADGNGRVARLLASTYLLRAASIPLWVETTDRSPYLDALAAADRGDHAAFVTLLERISLRLLREMTSVLRAVPAINEKQSRDAVRSGRAELGRSLKAALAADLGDQVGPLTERITVPRGLELGPTPEFVRIRGTKARRFWLAAAIDWTKGPGSRFVLVSGRVDSQSIDPVSLGEVFDEADVVPELTPSARRRIQAIVDRIVAIATTT